jgi:hypothetical protein
MGRSGGAAAGTIPGKNGLLPRDLAGRMDTPGPPATGTWNANDEVIDSQGALWRFVAEDRIPGAWNQITWEYQQLQPKTAIQPPMGSTASVTLAAWFNASSALFLRFDVEVGGIYRYVDIETGVASGNWALAVVALSGSGLTSYQTVMGTGVQPVPATGQQHVDLGASYLPPGPYALVLWCDNITATLPQLTSSRNTAAKMTTTVSALAAGIPANGGGLAWGSVHTFGATLAADLVTPGVPNAAVMARRAAWVATLASPLPAGLSVIGWDDFQRFDRTLQGDFAPSGQRYTHGGQNPVIRSKLFDASDPTLFAAAGTAILYQPQAVAAALELGEFIAKPGSTEGQNVVLGGCAAGLGQGSLQLTVYAVNAAGDPTTQWALFYVPHPIVDPYPVLAHGTLNLPITVDGASHNWLGLAVVGNTATVYLPDGQVVSVTDPAVGTFWGPLFASQLRRPLTTDGTMVFSYIEASA